MALKKKHISTSLFLCIVQNHITYFTLKWKYGKCQLGNPKGMGIFSKCNNYTTAKRTPSLIS